MTVKDIERVVRTYPHKFYEVGKTSVFAHYSAEGNVGAYVVIILLDDSPHQGDYEDGLANGGRFADGLQVWQRGITYTIKVSTLAQLITEEGLTAELDKGAAEIAAKVKELKNAR